jgi:hypothetical protein
LGNNLTRIHSIKGGLTRAAREKAGVYGTPEEISAMRSRCGKMTKGVPRKRKEKKPPTPSIERLTIEQALEELDR